MHNLNTSTNRLVLRRVKVIKINNLSNLDVSGCTFTHTGKVQHYHKSEYCCDECQEPALATHGVFHEILESKKNEHDLCLRCTVKFLKNGKAEVKLIEEMIFKNQIDIPEGQDPFFTAETTSLYPTRPANNLIKYKYLEATKTAMQIDIANTKDASLKDLKEYMFKILFMDPLGIDNNTLCGMLWWQNPVRFEVNVPVYA